MSQKTVALLLGLVTLTPPVFIYTFVPYFLIHKRLLLNDEYFTLFIAVQGVVLLFMFSLLAFYLWHLYTNKTIQGNGKMIWTIALFMASFIAMPIYWYKHVWSKV